MERYVLVTAARNEERYIGRTLDAVAAQTVRPVRWVVISDGSTDNTDAIAREFAGRHGFIDFVRCEDRTERAFSSQVYAQHFGCRRLKGLEYDFIGMLDGDISFEPEYYARVFDKFGADPKLGIAGGLVHEQHAGVFRCREMSSVNSVAGGVQLFRRDCFEAIGGYIPMKWGGMDTVAEAMARMRGWEARAFPELKAYHHKAHETWNPAGLRRRICEGRMDYSLGFSPAVELVKCLRRLAVEPYLVGSAFRLWGYVSSALCRQERSAPQEVLEFMRQEHKRRLRMAIRTGLGRGSVA
jgi:glycosyltransferase involved in cell wall biosynthesis